MGLNVSFNQGSGGNKRGSSFLAGLLLLVIGTVLLWWNEYNNVQNIAVLSAFEKEAVEIRSDIIQPEYDGKAVTTNGLLTVEDEPLQDGELDVAIKTPHLRRVVEMYQWKETEHTDDNRTSYSYSKVWDESYHSSSNFHDKVGHENPAAMPYKSKDLYSKEVKVGAYNLSNKQIEGLEADADFDIPADLGIEGYHKSGYYYTNSENIDNPNIGNIRISWKYNDWKEASVAAVVSGNTFKDYTIENSANSLNRVDEGLLSKTELVKNQKNDNNMLKWILRGVGALLILLGYLSLFGFITRFTSSIPILGSIVGGVVTAVSFLLAVIHSLLVIIIAWFRYRPVLAIVLLIIVILAIIGIVVLIKNKKKQQQN